MPLPPVDFTEPLFRQLVPRISSINPDNPYPGPTLVIVLNELLVPKTTFDLIPKLVHVTV